MIFSVFKKFGFSAILGPPYCGIGATILIGREMLCLPYAGFLCKLLMVHYSDYFKRQQRNVHFLFYLFVIVFLVSGQNTHSCIYLRAMGGGSEVYQ